MSTLYNNGVRKIGKRTQQIYFVNPDLDGGPRSRFVWQFYIWKNTYYYAKITICFYKTSMKDFQVPEETFSTSESTSAFQNMNFSAWGLLVCNLRWPDWPDLYPTSNRELLFLVFDEKWMFLFSWVRGQVEGFLGVALLPHCPGLLSERWRLLKGK